MTPERLDELQTTCDSVLKPEIRRALAAIDSMARERRGPKVSNHRNSDHDEDLLIEDVLMFAAAARTAMPELIAAVHALIEMVPHDGGCALVRASCGGCGASVRFDSSSAIEIFVCQTCHARVHREIKCTCIRTARIEKALKEGPEMKRKTRQQAIDILIEDARKDYDDPAATLKEILYYGHKGFDNYDDEDLEQAWKDAFDEPLLIIED